MAKRKMPEKEREDPFEDIRYEKEEEETFRVQIVGTKRLNVRKNPSLDSEILMVIPENSIAVVDSYDDKWFHTRAELSTGEIVDAYFVKLFAKRI